MTALDLQSFVSAAPDSYTVFSPDLTVLAISDLMLTTLQTGDPTLVREHLVGQNLLELRAAVSGRVNQAIVDDLIAGLREALDTREPKSLPMLKLEPPEPSEGGARPSCWSRSMTPVLDASGSASAVIYRIADVSAAVAAEKQAEARLAASESLFPLAMRYAPIGMAVVDVDGQWREVNAALAQMLGYTVQDMRGMTFQQVTHPDDFGTDVDHVRKLLDDEISSYSLRKRYIHRDGSTVWADLHATLLRGDDGTPLCFIAQMLDVTDSVRSHAAESQLLAQLNRSNEDLRRFAYVASHDLQAPLRTVGGFTEVLLGSLDPATMTDEQLTMARNITEGVSKMQRLIRDLLAYSRIDSNHRDVQDVSIAELCEEAIGLLASDIELAGAVVTCDVPDHAMADQGQLRRVLQNLIRNALIHHSRDRKPVVTVTSGNRGDGWVEVTVADNGPGIPAEQQDVVFEMFKQLRVNRGGTGIGLAIVKRIVDSYGGSIVIDSDGVSGSAFRFTVPAA